MSDDQEERTPRFAMSDPFSSQWMLNRLGGGAEFRSGQAWALQQGRPDWARRLGRTFAQLQASAADFEPIATSVDGSAEVPQAAGSGDSESPQGWWTTAEVAVQLKVSVRQVTNLIRDEKLTATRVGRQWLVDPVSVADHKQVRRPA